MTRQLIHARACYVDVRNCMLVALERATASRKAQVLCRANGDGRLACYDEDAAPTAGYTTLVYVTPHGDVHPPTQRIGDP